MTEQNSGAFSAGCDWQSIDWNAVEQHVRRLQTRIAKAVREGHWGKAKALSWLLTHSRSAKLLAVKRVTQNRGSKTAGVDNVILTTSKQKMLTAESLRRRGYQAQPLRRVYIPKKKGRRPLGIPTMKDRAMQALHLLALEPVSETTADRNSYGFRPKRSTADAIEQCFICLKSDARAQWILEGDIKSCFDRINHEWLLKNIPMDKTILKQWLSAGYVENQVLYPTVDGTPQGGIISPTLANMTLDGLEQAVYAAAQPRYRNVVSVARYADDWLVMAESKTLLKDKIKPAIITFLKERGLELSQEKTRITHIDDGFDFLGFNLRRYKGKLLIKPSKLGVTTFMRKIREIIKSNVTMETAMLINVLNLKIRGWAYYYRHVVSKKTFSNVDSSIYFSLRNWIRKRHPNKSWDWRRSRYFRRQEQRNWIFSTKTKDKSGECGNLDMFQMSSVPIKRHVKIRGSANPYNPEYAEYFVQRDKLKRTHNAEHWMYLESQMFGAER
jgi:RNA-directed DNA polymerase